MTRPGLLPPWHNWNDENIKTNVVQARQHGVLEAVQRHQKGDENEHKLSYQTIYGWLKYFQQNSEYVQTKKEVARGFCRRLDVLK